MRHILYLMAALAAHFVYGVGLAYGLGELGVLEVTGLHARSFVIGYFVLGVLGAVVSWIMADDVASWSVSARPDTSYEERLRRLAARLGLRRVPTLATYTSLDVNAFAISRWPAPCRIIVSTGAIQDLTSTQLDALLAHAMAKLASHDATTLLLLSGITNPFTLFPARLLSGLVGTSLRTSDEETPSDGIENSLRTVCEVLLTPLTGLLARGFGRAAERRAGAGAAAAVGGEALVELAARVRSAGRRTVTREMFLAPLACQRPSRARALP